MKEYLFPIVQETAGRTIVIDDVPETMTVDNILAIINKTQGKPVIGPLNMGDITDFDFDDGTITITFSNNLPALAVGDKLLVKCFTTTESGGEDPNSKAVAEFFGLPQALPEIEVATEQEVKDINDDVMGALYGYGKVTVTIHSLMRTGAETTQDLASVIYVDPEKTWAENGYPTLYDDEGEPIDTTTNPAAGDEVFNYQIQES